MKIRKRLLEIVEIGLFYLFKKIKFTDLVLCWRNNRNKPFVKRQKVMLLI